MKMPGRVTSCCVALFFALTSVSAVQRLNSINDLKRINYRQSVPKHSLVLLYWFANTVDIDNNNVILLTFDPNRRDYGSHHYGNYEGLLDSLPLGNRYRYYTIGNLNHETSMPLPPYVVRPPTGFVGRNRDRIIILVREQNIVGQALQIDQVYITQHYDTSEGQGTSYDPTHTYGITTTLLRQIREFSVGDDQQQLLHLRDLYGSNADLLQIRNTWGDLVCLGLLLFIVIQEKHSNQHNRHENKRNNQASKSRDPRNFQNQDYVAVNINNDEDYETSRTGNRELGSFNTSVPCNAQRNCCKSCICCICCICCIFCIIATIFYKIWYFI